MKKYWVQVLALTAWSFTFLIPILVRGTNIVTNTFTEGTLRFWAGTSPYEPSKIADVFHYSPLFAFLYWPFTELSSSAHALSWGFLNVLVFWMGVSVWFSFTKKTPKMIWLALALCAIELDISQRYQQINACLVGMVLLSLHFYKEEKFVWSALLISFITNIKLLPLVFAVLLCWPLRKRYILSLVLFSALWLFLPSIGVGFSRNIELHRLQFEAIFSDASTGHGGRPMLDLASTLTRLGHEQVAYILKIVVAGLAVLICSFARWKEKEVPEGLFYSFVMLTLLVLSPRSESPTFIFLAPAYLFAMQELKGPAKALIVLFGFFISFVFTSAWAPHFTWTYHHGYFSKVFGTYVFWWLAFLLLFLRLWVKPKTFLSQQFS